MVEVIKQQQFFQNSPPENKVNSLGVPIKSNREWREIALRAVLEAEACQEENKRLQKLLDFCKKQHSVTLASESKLASQVAFLEWQLREQDECVNKIKKGLRGDFV